MKHLFLALLAGALLFSVGTGPAFAADRYIIFVNDSTQKVSAALLQSENGKMAIVKYGDIEAGDSLTFDVPDVETIVRVRANHCAVQDPVFVARHRMQVILTAKCTLVVR